MIGNWNFLTDAWDARDLLLDCRSQEAYARSTLRSAHGAAVIKKPYGSGPRSQAALSGIVERVRLLAEGCSNIICFDEGIGMYAARMAWILRAGGLKNIKILSLKFQNLPPDQLEPGNTLLIEDSPSASSQNGESKNPDGLVSISFVQKNLTRVQLLDVRTPEEYEGIIPRMTNPDPGGLCGRIPGSINWDWRRLYGADGNLKEKSVLLSDIKRMGLIQERPTVIYDFNGARSCTAALVLTNCGYRQVNVYMGSWMEWRKSALPKQNLRAFAI